MTIKKVTAEFTAEELDLICKGLSHLRIYYQEQEETAWKDKDPDGFPFWAKNVAEVEELNQKIYKITEAIG